MLHKCANPECSRPFRRLDEGKLFQVEVGSFSKSLAVMPRPSASKPFRRVERYWLCDGCAPAFTLTYERGRGLMLLPLTQMKGAELPAGILKELPSDRSRSLAGAVWEGASYG